MKKELHLLLGQAESELTSLGGTISAAQAADMFLVFYWQGQRHTIRTLLGIPECPFADLKDILEIFSGDEEYWGAELIQQVKRVEEWTRAQQN